MSAATPEQVAAALERLRALIRGNWHTIDELNDLAIVAQSLATLEAERDALRAVVADLLALITNGWLLRNTTNDGHMPSYLAESARLIGVLSRAKALLPAEPSDG